jgi:protein TonB
MSADRAKSLVLWGGSLTLALSLHAAGAAALLIGRPDRTDAMADAPAITVDLAPAPAAPEIRLSDLPPGPQASEAPPEPEKPKPVEKAELPPPPQTKPDAAAAVLPPPKPADTKTPKPHQASLPSAPPAAEHKDRRTAAPAPGAHARDGKALLTWKSQLVAALERSKRAADEHGIALLAFSIDRHGGVHHARIAHSSGSTTLDRETLALLARAAPLPPPPLEIAGGEIAVVVPIRYNMR